ncbi:hypothetical protein BDF19DRAFT_323277 [Syncephalis fuscata]|nr:hypothetical protein BDF19DRAFT_323277 [Syncephalis fuscata]
MASKNKSVSSSSSDVETSIDHPSTTSESSAKTIPKEDKASVAADDNAAFSNDGTMTWGPWQACWDDTSAAYYYWNAETNETTWICPWAQPTTTVPPPPLPPSENTPSDNNEEKEGSDAYTAEQYPLMNDEDAQTYAEFMASGGGTPGSATNGGYAASAHFNARTGRFQADLKLNPDNYTTSARMQRQCDAFFDYNSFAAERGTGNKRAKLTKQQLDKAKKRNKEKREARKRAWLNAID